MSEPIRHHFVPRVYLSNFCGADENLWCYDSETGSEFKGLPKELAKKRDYNSILLEGGRLDRNTMERFYGDFESLYPRIMTGLQQGSLSFEDERAIIILAALQIMRSPMTRDFLEMIAKAILPRDTEKLLALRLTNREIEILDKARQGNRREGDELSLHLSGHTFTATTLILERLNYSIVKLEDCPSLITSDNPVFLGGLEKHRKNGWKLLPNLPVHRTILLYPLSRETLLFGDSKGKIAEEIFAFDYFMIRKSRQIHRSLSRLLSLTCRRNLYCSDRAALNDASVFKRSMASDLTKASVIAGLAGRIVSSIYSQRVPQQS